MECYWLKKTIILPLRRLCLLLTSRLRYRKKGSILMLSTEVEACEYEDVQIMWEMLKKTDTTTHHQVARSSIWMKNKRLRNAFAWARWCTCLSKTF
ncbi:hypothetical protein RND81_13G144500 [Saponaria officinalis]|uniref:Uncharacterized protein n=1 Tax=Saponaria officinalis TaxID=3572 RepID=A0AAW1GZW5_SAPOF